MALSLERMQRSAEALERGRIHYVSGRFFEAHEAWEAAWHQEDGLMRRLLQGLIMAAGAYQKLAEGQPRGMTLLLERALEQLRPVRDGFGGLDLTRLRGGLERSLVEARAWQGGAPAPAGPAPLAASRQPTGPGEEWSRQAGA